jgi:hypothetical protein
LQSPWPVNSLFHLELAALLLLIKPIRLVLSFSDLLVQHLFLVVFERTQLLHLSVNHLLSDHQCIFGSSLNCIHPHLVLNQFLPRELFNACFLLQLFLSKQLCSPDLVGISLHNVCLDASSLLLALQLSDFFSF